MFVLLRERTMQHSIFAHHNSSTSDSTSCGILCTRRVCNNKLSRLSPRGTTLILHVPNCMLCALFYLPCIASQLSCAGAGCAVACARRAHPFNGLCVQPCSRWDMIIDICTLQAMKSNIFEYACMYLQYISLCKKAGKAYCENEK